MTITLHPHPGKVRRDGSRLLFVRLTFKRQHRLLATSTVLTGADLTRGGALKSATSINDYDAIVRRIRAASSTIDPFALDAMTIDEVVGRIRTELTRSTFTLDFVRWCWDYAATKAPGTRRNYETSAKALEDYCREKKLPGLDINAVNKALLLDFQRWAAARPKASSHYKLRRAVGEGSDAQAVHILAKLSTAYNAAKARYNDEDAGIIFIPRSPFSSLKLVAPPVGNAQGNLGEAVVQRIIDARGATEAEDIALAAFVLSFGLMGANLADLYEMRPPTDGVVMYHRRKTRTRRPDKAQMVVRVDPRLTGYAARLYGRRKGLFLPKLSEVANDSYITAYVNNGLRSWAKREGIPPFTFYAARKSWASIARNKAGVDKATVDECLCHRGTLQLADIYIERDWSIPARANKAVLDLFRWP